MRPLCRRALALVMGLLIVATGLTGTASPAGAAPARNDSMNEPIYFVPGFTDAEGHNCRDGYWGEAMSALRSWGWTGNYNTIGYYANDVNCTDQVARVGVNTSIWELGRLLAWRIYNEYSYREWSVDAVGHSLGGLIIRAALYGTAQGWGGWPPYIYVEDVVTISTPHNGTGWAGSPFCGGSVQCQEMTPGSSFLSGLGQNPQSAQGTDWTLIGADDDDVVPTENAMAMDAGHKVKYTACPFYEQCTRFEHNVIHKITTGAYPHYYWNYHDPGWWYYDETGAATIRSTWGALRYWWRW